MHAEAASQPCCYSMNKQKTERSFRNKLLLLPNGVINFQHGKKAESTKHLHKCQVSTLLNFVTLMVSKG
jgi:ribosomal protein L34E